MKTYIIKIIVTDKITLYQIYNQVSGEVHTTWADFTKAHHAVRDLNDFDFKKKVVKRYS